MRDKILIGCILCLFSFIPKGAANNYIMNPYTHQEISADSIIERVMTFAPLYETIVSDYRANLYIKGKMDIQKKNFILRYVPVSYTHLRAHETRHDLVCRLLLEKKKNRTR